MLAFSARSIFGRGVVLRNYWDDFANFIRGLFRSKQTKTRANENKTAEVTFSNLSVLVPFIMKAYDFRFRN
ncbi:hypothetical protein ANCCAN_25295 [Ancylostoma caninum]|uniref:Uncharacterized protein n=1 Tax=Ancylostoma caninum TaxID=29170 RepID=A0A368FDU2_ANCCA|nr:hypothetical protein ANCCAN_25295 [Ancylostoma caninum]